MSLNYKTLEVATKSKLLIWHKSIWFMPMIALLHNKLVVMSDDFILP